MQIIVDNPTQTVPSRLLRVDERMRYGFCRRESSAHFQAPPPV
jgi:hypothetical protein